MRLAAYLSTSRHGIFYFRSPLPTDNHPARKRGHVKVSLATREPRQAAQFARLLAVAGQTLLSRPKVQAMRYDDIRKHVQEHFGQMLREFRESIAARTMNVYLGHMQHFFGWAVDNGYAADNVFQGLRLKRTARTEDEGRKAFSAEQLQLMFSHLTDPGSPLVKKDVHKWPALIGMFTGMRLNEVAQLEVGDIELRDDVWCINVTPDGEGNKRLKNASSKRRVPVHDKLVASGFFEFYQTQKASGHTRLFPDLTYSPQNGYGRNAGRWFNERFLPELGLGDTGLVFHCLRHTMITRLAQAGVGEPLVKAIVGHSQTGVTYSTYFKEGFLPAQLSGAINRFDF